MKKQRFFMLGIITVLVAVLSLTFVSSTFAKYTSTVTGNDSARVAKWAWTYTPGAEANTIKFDLFNTVLDSDGSAETDIKNADGTIIAPGTQGSFELKFTNDSEVNAEYSIKFNVENANDIPVEFSTNNAHWGSLSDLSAVVNMGEEASQTIYWRWVFEGDNAKDTALGAAATATVKVTATVTWTQVD